jgi:hypothetical protein
MAILSLYLCSWCHLLHQSDYTRFLSWTILTSCFCRSICFVNQSLEECHRSHWVSCHRCFELDLQSWLLMHVKCTHKVRSLVLSYSFIFAYYLRSWTLFTLILGISLRSPLFFVSNSTEQNFVFCIFFLFQEPSVIKWTQSFRVSLFLEKNTSKKKKSTQRLTRRKRGRGTLPDFLDVWWAPTSPGSSFLLFLGLHGCLLMKKTTIIGPPPP